MKENKGKYLTNVRNATGFYSCKLINEQEWVERVIGKEAVGIYSDEYIRRAINIFKMFLDNFDETEEDVDTVSAIAQVKEELEKERKKLQTVNSEYNLNLRIDARNELFQEKIIEAIRGLEPVKVKNIKHSNPPLNNTGLLCVSDLHAGSTFTVNGIWGEKINEYNFEIMQNRLWKLSSLIEADAIEYDKLIVAFLGDYLENILRMTSLTKLREPVIDTTIKLSEFLVRWLADLQDRIERPIHIVMVSGNHDTQSILGSNPRPAGENLGKIIHKFIEIRFENNPHITIEPFGDAIVKSIEGVNVLFNHGEDVNLKDTLDYFDNVYDIDIDEIFVGHFHRPESKAVGISDLGDKTVYRVGSIMGIDPYAKKIRKAARPSAYFAVYERGVGHSWSKNYYL